MFDWSLNMKEKSVHGRAASVGRLLAEAKDYSRVEFVVNVYFESKCIYTPRWCSGLN